MRLWKVTWPLHLEDEGTGPENYFFQQVTSLCSQNAASALEGHAVIERGEEKTGLQMILMAHVSFLCYLSFPRILDI